MSSNTPKPQANKTIPEIIDEFETELLSALATARDTHRLTGKDTGFEYFRNRTKIHQEATKAIEAWHKKEQIKLLQPLFDEASYASERAERKDLHSNVDNVLYLIESELAKLKGGETE